MGAAPAWATLALTLPRADAGWLDGFARGLSELACAHGVALVGGDTTAGPLTISVQILGHVPRGSALRRGGGKAGDVLAVTGTLGDAGAGLALATGALELKDPAPARELLQRFEYPTPRVEFGIAARGIASAAMDISDGLVGDLPKLAAAGGLGAAVDVERLPMSRALQAAGDAEQARYLGAGRRRRLRTPDRRAARAFQRTRGSRRAIELNTYRDRGAQSRECGELDVARSRLHASRAWFRPLSPSLDPNHSLIRGPRSILCARNSTSPQRPRLPLNNIRPKITRSLRHGRAALPEKIGKYVIINEVGRGSTGAVYLSHDPYYGRDVAIKVYNVDSSGDENRKRIARKMFLSEAHMVGMLQHPNILPIYDAGEENGHCYIVTEHVHGARTLAAYCRPDNLLRIDDVVELVYKAARALALCAQPRRHSSRHQAEQHHAHARQRRAHHRLRHRVGGRLRDLENRRHCRQSRRTCRPSRCNRSSSPTARICTRWAR